MDIKEKLDVITEKGYRDPTAITDTDIQELTEQFNSGEIITTANILASWLAEKMYGVDVRQALAFWAILTADFADLIRRDENSFKNQIGDRQDQLETRQTSLEDVFKTLQSGSTDDAEVKTARSSEKYGAFDVLDDRLENIEQILAAKVPSGYSVTIAHSLGYNPTVKARYYEYAIGTETDGLGTGPDSKFGEINATDIAIELQYINANSMIVNMPADYAMDNQPEKKPDGNWYIIQGYKTIKLELS